MVRFLRFGSQERRKFERVYKLVDVTYAAQNTPNKNIISLGKDFCFGGIKLLPDKRLTTDDLIDIKIDVPDRSEPVSALGKVVWRKRKKEMGVRFLMVKPDDEYSYYDYFTNRRFAELRLDPEDEE